MSRTVPVVSRATSLNHDIADTPEAPCSSIVTFKSVWLARANELAVGTQVRAL